LFKSYVLLEKEIVMKEIIIQCSLSLVTGLAAGIIFALFKLPIPAPPVIPAVFGILGITLGYVLFQTYIG
jgi:XapX domain-containing protein